MLNKVIFELYFFAAAPILFVFPGVCWVITVAINTGIVSLGSEERDGLVSPCLRRCYVTGEVTHSVSIFFPSSCVRLVIESPGHFATSVRFACCLRGLSPLLWPPEECTLIHFFTISFCDTIKGCVCACLMCYFGEHIGKMLCIYRHTDKTLRGMLVRQNANFQSFSQKQSFVVP